MGISLVAAALLAGSPTNALEPGQRVDNFRLVDHRGAAHELYYLSDQKAVVLTAHGNGCGMPETVATLDALRARAGDAPVEFLMLHTNPSESRDAVQQAAERLGIDMPVLMDETQLIGESLGLRAAGETLVIDPKTWTVVARGMPTASGDDPLSAALDALVKGEPVAAAPAVSQPLEVAAGCAVHTRDASARAADLQISYSKTIAPMLIENCVTCHRTGGIGPWQMSSYAMVKGFSPMIREVLRTQRMPPWHADPHYLAFSNDRSLSQDEVRTLVHWVEAGSPRGDGNDPLAEYKKEWPEWALGEPDLLVEIPAFDVPATGVLPYRNVSVPLALDHDVWVRAVDFKPGDRRVVHHILAAVGGGQSVEEIENGEQNPQVAAGADSRENLRERFRRAQRNRSAGSLGGYVPGAAPLQIPPESGILVKKGSQLQFQMHYTPNGRETVDATRMGLYFMKEPPQYLYRAAVLMNPRLRIPAQVKEHAETATYVFQRDALVYSVHPHAHFRGRSARFVAQFPNGREEVLLNVPRYDFNWQSTYELEKPLPVPAGTRVTYTGVYDNSSQNKANPDPNRIVPLGQQTWDEMLYGVLRFRNVVEPEGGE